MAETAKTQELISKEPVSRCNPPSMRWTILIHNAWKLEDLVPLKGIVCQLIRPMLKAWLDDKLPAVVERLVLIEIERRHSEW